MKTYLIFNIDGTVVEQKTKKIVFEISDYCNFTICEYYNYNNNKYALLYNANSENNCIENISKVPFIDRKINGIFMLLKLDSENSVISITEKTYSKLFNWNSINIDYSSDDFTADTCTKLNEC